MANTLGPNPAEALIRGTGDWVLRFLCLGLAVTPLRLWTGQPALARFRRMIGLFAFFYATLHFLAYAWLDMGLDLATIVVDIPKRPFALVGFLAFLLMVPLAATSFNRAIKALGAARWQALHRLVYASALLGLLHFFWMRAAKNNFGEVAIYAAILAGLLGWRLLRWHRRVRAPAVPEASAARRCRQAARSCAPERAGAPAASAALQDNRRMCSPTDAHAQTAAQARRLRCLGGTRCSAATSTSCPRSRCRRPSARRRDGRLAGLCRKLAPARPRHLHGRRRPLPPAALCHAERRRPAMRRCSPNRTSRTTRASTTTG